MQDRCLNVVHIIGAMPVGGVERNLLRILPMLDHKRFKVSMVTIRERGELASALEKAGIPVRLEYFDSRYSPGSIYRLAKYLREIKADIVHCHMRRANTSGRIAAMFAGVPVRIAHERDLGLGKRKRHYLVDNILGRLNGPILAVTRGTISYNRIRSGLPESKFKLLYNGLDVKSFSQSCGQNEERKKYGLPPDLKLVGSIGRLHQIKNLPLLLQAFAELRKEQSGIGLVIVGEGKEESALHSLADELEIEAHTYFLPWQHDLSSIYAVLDVFVLTSRSEGIANVQMEAAAAGIPLVSTRVGIAAEVYREGEHYLGVDSNVASVKQGIAEALIKEKANKLAAAGRKIIQQFTLEEQKRNLEAIYTELWQQYRSGKGLVEI